MNEKEFKDRAKKIALRVIKLVESLPETTTSKALGKQLLRMPLLSEQITGRLVEANPLRT